ncbi:hypothetical protein A0J48_006245 [Sphaerospermopsis aphanizomenoides BCCUSP55]|uniref:Ycf66 family protein n=1 Tax=Sphaerospermopsis aphanizomenoides TaxID=459663 RepID=UPI0019043802|nr:Ycf66 family protein [Sphaerospermopsis aphanizomenoides]MBK1987140.1 hypothetical protein [Sphaerospermopsis aphanizomenoides BCCUSP55]
MLAYLLALVVALGSLAIYISAFFFPEIHRKNDFVWSGVGLFYALVLWIFAPRITGGLLLGHIASVSLLVWFGWQTLSLRRQLTPEVQQTPIPSPELIKVSVQEQVAKFSWQEKLSQLPTLIGNVFSGVKGKVQQTVSKTPSVPTNKPVVEIIDNTTPIPEPPSPVVEPPAEEISTEAESVTSAEPTTESVSQTEVTVPANPKESEVVTEAVTVPSSEPLTESISTTETEESQASTPLATEVKEEIVADVTPVPPVEAPPEKTPPTDGNGG